MADRFSLVGKVAVITGGSRGLGRAMAQAFAEAGADLVIASRKQDACDAVAAEISAATGRRCIGAAFHAGSWDDAERLHELAWNEFGSVHVLVNNAGMSPLFDSLTAVTQELWDKVLDVNLRGPFRLSALMGEAMAAGDGGSIISISSIAAVQFRPQELPYGCAKVGLHAMALGVAQAYGPKVRSNVIMPGAFLTDVTKHWDMEEFERTAKATFALQRAGRPDEIVGTALYLASDASSYTTGAVIKVDGGAAVTPG